MVRSGGQSRPPLQWHPSVRGGGQSRPPLQLHPSVRGGGQSRPPLQWHPAVHESRWNYQLRLRYLIVHRGGQSRPPLRLGVQIGSCAFRQCKPSRSTRLRTNSHIPEAGFLFCKRSNYSALSRPVASLNSLMSSSISLACAWTASQVPLVSYHRALRSWTSRACCSTQV